MLATSARPGCGGMCGVWSGPHAEKRPSRASRPCMAVGHEALGCRPEVACMRRASRHEDVYQKCVHSTRARRRKTCTAALQTPTNMHTHRQASHAASARGALDDDADGTSATLIARAPAAKLYAACAVQVVELEVPAGGRGASEGRPAAAAGWQQQPRLSASRGHSRRPRRRWRGRRPARARGTRRG